jgi:hypothetical protein
MRFITVSLSVVLVVPVETVMVQPLHSASVVAGCIVCRQPCARCMQPLEDASVHLNCVVSCTAQHHRWSDTLAWPPVVDQPWRPSEVQAAGWQPAGSSTTHTSLSLARSVQSSPARPHRRSHYSPAVHQPSSTCCPCHHRGSICTVGHNTAKPPLLSKASVWCSRDNHRDQKLED